MTPQELKKSILQRAIEGKLVEQRTEEGTAETLYAEIQAEKKKLIAEGKIKKEKPLAPITDDEKTFEIPKSWMWVRFGELAQLLNADKVNGIVYPYLEAKFLRRKSEPTMLTEGKFIKKNTLIILVDGENSGEVFKTIVDGYMGSTFKVLYFPAALNEKYVLSYLSYHKEDYRNNKKGAAIPHLNKKLFFGALFPLPPLAEQHRIVAKIEELMPLCEQYEKSWNRLQELNKLFPQELKKSILQRAIEGKLVEQRDEEGTAKTLYAEIQAEKQKLIAEGKIKKEKPLEPITDDEKPFEIPESWMWVRVGQFATVQSSKRVFEKDYVSKGIPFFRSKEIGDLCRGENIKTELFITEEHYNSLSKNYGVPRAGDILITSVGTIGNTWICDKRKFYYKDGNITQICGNKSFNSRYLEYFLHSPIFESQALSTVAGTAYSALTIVKLKNLIFPLPPLAEQHRIVAKIEELLPLCDKLTTTK